MRPLLAVVLLLTPLARAGQFAPSRRPVDPNLAAFWSGAVGTYLRAPKSADPARFAEVLAAMRALDLTDPLVRASVEPVALQLQASAARLLAAEKPDLAGLAALTQACAILPLPEAQAARLAQIVGELSERKRAALDARMRQLAATLGDQSQPAADDADPVIVLPEAPHVPLDRRVVVVYLTKEDGKRGSGKDQATELKELVARYPGRVRLLDRDAGSSFMSVSALEIAPSAREDVLRELAAIEGLGSVPLPTLVAAGFARGESARAQDLAEVKKRLEHPDLQAQLGALADLSARLDSMPPEAIAAIPEAERNELLGPLLQLGWTLKTSFEMIRQSDDSAIRKREYAARGEKVDDYLEFERAVHAILAEPVWRARSAPSREVFIRVLAALDRLDTRDMRERVLEDLGEARHAGLEFAASDPRRKLKYVKAWVDLVAGSVAETMFGLRSGLTRDDKWSGSNSSGGYEHVEGRRQSTYLFEWRPWRVNPGDLRTAAPQLLGIPGMNGHMVNLVVETLAKVQADVAALDATNRQAHVKRAVAQSEERLSELIKEAINNGQQIDPAAVARLREQALARANEEYDRYYQVDGHGVVDRFISSLYYAPYYAALIPGFKEATYVASVLTIFQQAFGKIDEIGMVKQLSDAALSFLSNLKDQPILKDRPELRGQAGDLWATISQTAAARGIGLITKLDGVLDQRAEVNPAEPKLFEQDGQDKYATVWQVAERADGKYIARAGGDRVVKVWERATGKLVKKIVLEDARQHYGDLDNSLGVTFDKNGRLVVATLHDRAEEGKRSSSFQMIRVYDMDDPKVDLLPGDELASSTLEGVHILREMPITSAGMLAIAETRRYDDRRWQGSDIKIFSMSGVELGKIDDFMLLDTQENLVLGTRTHFGGDLGFGLFDVSQPGAPADVTPAWLKRWVDDWSRRNQRNEYGWWPSLNARLGVADGKPALMIPDEGKLHVFDLATGELVRALEIPNGWDVPSYATDATGTKAAALVQAPGRLHPVPQRVMVWNLATGELLVERKTGDKSQLIFTRDGKQLIAAGRGPTHLLELP